MNFLALYNYWVVIILMMAGLYILIARHNLVKKLIGLSIFQTSIFYLYISIGKVTGGTAPILLNMPAHGSHDSAHAEESVATSTAIDAATESASASATNTSEVTAAAVQSLVSPAANAGETIVYSNPLTHVLILTAIVVGVATTALGLALIVRINEAYGSIEEDEIRAMEQKDPA